MFIFRCIYNLVSWAKHSEMTDNHWQVQINWGRGKVQSLVVLSHASVGLSQGYFSMFIYVFNHSKTDIQRKTPVKPVNGLWNRYFIPLNTVFSIFLNFPQTVNNLEAKNVKLNPSLSLLLLLHPGVSCFLFQYAVRFFFFSGRIDLGSFQKLL